MNKKLVIATHNENKVKEFKEIFKDTNYEIVSLHDINFHDEIIEDGTTFQDNALIKALAVHHITKLPVIADDSGLSISALDGFPGVNSARFMQDSTYTEKNLKIVEMLKDHSDKSAKFVAAIALVGLTSFPQVFVGEVKGLIINEERGTNGFGYDPIFFYPDFQKTFGELTIGEKKSISHRGVASELLLKFLNELKD